MDAGIGTVSVLANAANLLPRINISGDLSLNRSRGTTEDSGCNTTLLENRA